MTSVRLYQNSDKQLWDAYVMRHPDSTHCHLSGWKDVIEKAYGHIGYYLLAEEDCKIKGIVPVFHIKSFLFGNQLVSMPFLNYGGILADNEETEIALLSEAVKLGQKLKASTIELRHTNPLSCLNSINLSREMPCNEYVRGENATRPVECGNYYMGSLFHRDSTNSSNSSNPMNPMNPINSTNPTNPSNPSNCVTKTHKVRMLLELPGSSDELFKSYNAKLRSQIRRPQKEGMDSIVGGAELLDDFYKVFSINMRDLGSPVHSKNLFKEILKHFEQNVRIGIVTYKGQSVAAGMIFLFKNVIEIPWASTLRKYNQFSPNMLLYWSFLEYACKNGHQYFDFGRSTQGEGTHKFKEQWGAKPFPMYWHNIVLNGRPAGNNESEKSRYETAIRYWKKLPLPISNALGPLIRKHINL